MTIDYSISFGFPQHSANPGHRLHSKNTCKKASLCTAMRICFISNISNIIHTFQSYCAEYLKFVPLYYKLIHDRCYCQYAYGGDDLKIYTYLGRKNISGERIYAARMALKLSQSELAARMQINGVTLEREAISKIETGKRFVADYELRIFAKVLGVSMEWLTLLQEEKKQEIKAPQL